MKKLYSEYYGGVIDVQIVTIDKLPNKARYKYTDEREQIDVYMFTDINQGEEVFYGIAW